MSCFDSDSSMPSMPVGGRDRRSERSGKRLPCIQTSDSYVPASLQDRAGLVRGSGGRYEQVGPGGTRGFPTGRWTNMEMNLRSIEVGSRFG